MENNRIKIDISTSTVIKIALIILGIWFLYAVRDIAILFFFVLVIVAALAPLVDKISKYIPRFLAVAILALIFIGILVAIGFLIIPPLISQIGQLAINLPLIINKLGPLYHNLQAIIPNYQESLLNLSSQLGNLTSGIYSTTIGFITGIVGLFTIFVMAFYMLLEQNAIKDFVGQIVPADHKEKIFEIVRKISDKMGSWLRGHVTLMLAIGILDGIALTILGVPFALTLAVWGGLMEIIPYIGPWLALIPAAALAFSDSPLKALIVIIVYVLIQQLEAQFLTPKILGKAVGLSPVIIILAILVGAKLAGILGVIIAVPAAAAISVIFQQWSELKKIKL